MMNSLTMSWTLAPDSNCYFMFIIICNNCTTGSNSAATLRVETMERYLQVQSEIPLGERICGGFISCVLVKTTLSIEGIDINSRSDIEEFDKSTSAKRKKSEQMLTWMNENTYFCQISLDINRIIFQLKKMERKIEKYIYVSEQIEVQLLNKYILN